MTDNFDSRLGDLIVRKNAADRAAQAAKDARARQEADDNEKKIAARAKWNHHCLPIVHGVINAINVKSRIEAGFEIAMTEHPDTTAAITNIVFKLVTNGSPTRQELHLNVNAFGSITGKTPLPFEGSKIQSHIDLVDRETVERWLLNFITESFDRMASHRG